MITEISTNITTMAMFLARCVENTSLTVHERLCRKVLIQLQSLVNQDRVDEEIFTNKLHEYYQKISKIAYYEQ